MKIESHCGGGQGGGEGTVPIWVASAAGRARRLPGRRRSAAQRRVGQARHRSPTPAAPTRDAPSSGCCGTRRTGQVLCTLRTWQCASTLGTSARDRRRCMHPYTHWRVVAHPTTPPEAIAHAWASVRGSGAQALGRGMSSGCRACARSGARTAGVMRSSQRLRG